jgi:hypothetical protein
MQNLISYHSLRFASVRFAPVEFRRLSLNLATGQSRNMQFRKYTFRNLLSLGMTSIPINFVTEKKIVIGFLDVPISGRVIGMTAMCERKHWCRSREAVKPGLIFLHDFMKTVGSE